MGEERTVRRLYYGNPNRKMPRGRSKGRWKDSVFEDLKKAGVPEGGLGKGQFFMRLSRRYE